LVKTHKTALVLIPPEKVWEPIQAIRGERDRQIRRWMPHITLVYPFRPLAEFSQLEGPLSRALQGFPPLEVELSGFRYFQHKKKSFTLWLAPEPRERIMELQHKLNTVVPDCNDVATHGSGFQPHLSVGQFRGDRSGCLELLNTLGREWKTLRFLAEKVSLIWRGNPPDDIFRVDRTISLGPVMNP
jgi:2'-5' RNA ligase